MEAHEATALAYGNGYENGYKKGCEDGYRDGYKEGRNIVATQGCRVCKDYDRFIEAVCYLPNDNGTSTDILINYCPNCGRKMTDL